MTRIVLLDSGPLGMLTHPRRNHEITAWLFDVRRRGTEVRVSDVADYEVRRELLRANRTASIDRLDALARGLGLIEITRPVLLRAAEIWAEARRQGKPTASDAVLEADVIIAAQAQLAESGGDVVIVATDNVGHLSRFVDARDWQTIR